MSDLYKTPIKLPRRLLATILKRRNCWNPVQKYFRLLVKRENTNQRINFITKCKGADIIPRFLRFRVPENGCFRAYGCAQLPAETAWSRTQEGQRIVRETEDHQRTTMRRHPQNSARHIHQLCHLQRPLHTQLHAKGNHHQTSAEDFQFVRGGTATPTVQCP